MNTTLLKHPQKLTIDGLPNIYLRLIKQADTPELHKVINEDRQHLQIFQRWAREVSSLKSTRKKVREAVEEVANGSRLQYRIIAIKSGKPAIVGNLTFYDHDPKLHIANLGYWIIKPFEGKGYVFCTAQRLISYGFEEWQLKKIRLIIASGNERSEHLAKKLGAKLTDEISTEKINGQVFNDHIWEILKP